MIDSKEKRIKYLEEYRDFNDEMMPELCEWIIRLGEKVTRLK